MIGLCCWIQVFIGTIQKGTCYFQSIDDFDTFKAFNRTFLEMISIGLENLCGDSGNEITSVLKPGLLCVEISLIVVGLTLEFFTFDLIMWIH